MNRDEFRQHMNNYKKARESNPSLSYWQWKANKYAEGTDGITNTTLPEVVVTPRRNYVNYPIDQDAYNSAMLDAWGKQTRIGPEDVVDYVPVIGDIKGVYDIAKDFANKEYLAGAIGLGTAILPNVLEKPLKKVYRFVKDRWGKQGLVRSIYNNVAPGSYYDSYIEGGSKKDELKNAVKDYLLGKGNKVQPKWEDWFKKDNSLKGFISRNSDKDYVRKYMTDARIEAWQNYLGIPHDDKYLINTGIYENGLPVYRSNLTAIPDEQLQHIVDASIYRPNSFVYGDYINSVGGNVNIRYSDTDNFRRITSQDIWDLNPFKNADEARILPNWLRNRYSHIEVQPNGYRKYIWNEDAPKWLTDLEPSKILNLPGPFLNRTTFTARKIDSNQATYKKRVSKEDWINQRLSMDEELLDHNIFESNKDFKDWKNQMKTSYTDQYNKLLKENPEILEQTHSFTRQQLLNKYGPYLIKQPRKFENGTDGIVDELKANSRTTLTPEEQRYLLNKSRQRQRMSGAITPVFDIQDAVDFTPIGDVLTARDAYDAVQDRDYIKASAMLGLMLAPPALGRIAKEKIPSFVTAAADKINELRGRERRNKELDTKIFSQGIEDRNRIIEELYDTPGIWDRAYNADITYGTNYVDTYDNLINNYYSNYFNLPEPVRKDIGDAQAMMSAKPEAIRRYNDEGIPASWSDFAYYINPSIENLDKALTRHEMGHYVDFNMSKSNNADRGNLMFDELRKDLSVDPNPLIPNKTDYFRQGTEQKSYMNTLRQFMFDNNMINRIDDQVTQKQIKEAINKLPSELKSVKAAYQQFKSPRKYTKWFNTIPLLGSIPFIYNYSQEKDSN